MCKIHKENHRPRITSFIFVDYHVIINALSLTEAEVFPRFNLSRGKLSGGSGAFRAGQMPSCNSYSGARNCFLPRLRLPAASRLIVKKYGNLISDILPAQPSYFSLRDIISVRRARFISRFRIVAWRKTARNIEARKTRTRHYYARASRCIARLPRNATKIDSVCNCAREQHRRAGVVSGFYAVSIRPVNPFMRPDPIHLSRVKFHVHRATESRSSGGSAEVYETAGAHSYRPRISVFRSSPCHARALVLVAEFYIPRFFPCYPARIDYAPLIHAESKIVPQIADRRYGSGSTRAIINVPRNS